MGRNSHGTDETESNESNNVELQAVSDERGPHGDRNPCEEFLVVDGAKIPVTGVRVGHYGCTGSPPENVIDFDTVERDGDEWYATADYGDSCVELNDVDGSWQMYYIEDPRSTNFETVWERLVYRTEGR